MELVKITEISGEPAVRLDFPYNPKIIDIIKNNFNYPDIDTFKECYKIKECIYECVLWHKVYIFYFWNDSFIYRYFRPAIYSKRCLDASRKRVHCVWLLEGS